MFFLASFLSILFTVFNKKTSKIITIPEVIPYIFTYSNYLTS